MEVDLPVPLQQVAPTGGATVLCCNCGVPMDGTSGMAMCYDCIKTTVDISEGVQREATLHFCRGCDRFLQPPQHWITAAPESRELLALCLRKLRGLNKVRIIDASFIWTEPHSRRVKVKITVQQEAFEKTILQQSFEVEYVVAYQQCPDCAKSYTANTWRACIQMRQKVSHKRTFLWLEQLILKHNAHRDCINIREVKDGLDFFFLQRTHAQKMLDFLSSVSPIKTKKSEELISQDIHTSTKSFKFTYSVELIPICKDDLVVLPIKMAKSLGNINPIVLCNKVGNATHYIDPNTLQTCEIATPVYWRAPFGSIADASVLTEFIVLDIEPLGPTKGRHVLADATIAKASDMGVSDTTYLIRTHLGAVLHPGDSAMGYFLSGTVFNNIHFEEVERHEPSRIPEVILVKKHYPRRKKHKSRNWRLKRMARDEGELLPKKADQEKMEREFEMFMRDVEEDEDLRQTLALYKSNKPRGAGKMEGIETAESGAMEVDGETDDGENDSVPDIDVDELLDDMDNLTVNDEKL
ncbi:hypothetical protein TWF173_004332 [Orbilia oligospora]|nr:hypothetical protein TWF173_004332 [Orbilia oligospora]